MDFIREHLDQLERSGLRRQLREVASPQDRAVTIDGRELLCFCSNNYLGLANDRLLKNAAIHAVECFGTSGGASRLVCGNLAIHRRLEQEIASLKGADDAILFPTGYAANAGTIPALVGRDDAVIIDRLNHASIVDACRLSGAKLLVYPHADVEALEGVLARRKEFRRVPIITDGVFSMDGDIAPLCEIVELAKRFDAMTMVDDAHATGVVGSTGGGTPEHFGLAGRIDVVMGTLSKAVGSIGGFVAGSSELIDYLRNTARSFIYTTAPAPGTCAAAIEGLRLVREEPGRREQLWRHAARIREAFTAAGLDCGAGSTPIIPLMLGDAERAVDFAEQLYDRGVLAIAIRPPTVPRGTSRLRITPIATHSKADVDHLIDAVLAIANASP